ncbi:MAG: DedA family protein [Acidimicrobiaceae bacterium]|nr:DedA family protein [Acidimicrobiaceae bacterium]
MENFITSSGYIAILVLMVAESACIPIPSELIMTFGGVIAATGKLNLAFVIAMGTIGNVIGAYIAWAVGRTGGRALVLRYGKYVFLRVHDLERAERWFAKRGQTAVFLGRLLPVVRTFISLPAGVAEMEPVRFGIYTLLGSIPFVGMLAGVGYAVGSNYKGFVKDIQDVGYLIALVVVILIAVFVFKRIRNNPSEISDSV